MALLDNLLTLHRVDSQVRALSTRVESARTYFNAQERQIALLEKQKGELETQTRQLQASVHALEVEQTAATDRVNKLRGELNNSTNDKQYKAILNEMKVLETQKDEIVKRAVDEMQRVEETKKRLEVHIATIAERRKIRELAKLVEQYKDDVSIAIITKNQTMWDTEIFPKLCDFCHSLHLHMSD
jgi:predicted  nucleic acid-binding Zn-ribbon protein